jgi:AcrR family transcriptional regulator
MSRPYESPSRKAQADATRLSIIRALVDLLVDEHPSTISVPRVAEKAGVSVRIVYHYFPTKDALFDGLLAALPDLVDRYEDPPPAHTPKELADSMPIAFRYLERNAELFRAMRLSEWGARIDQHRAPLRSRRIDDALEPLQARVEDDEYRLVRAVIGLVTSFDGYDAMTSRWGLTRDEAAEAAAWVTRVLSERAKRSGVQP